MGYYIKDIPYLKFINMALQTETKKKKDYSLLFWIIIIAVVVVIALISNLKEDDSSSSSSSSTNKFMAYSYAEDFVEKQLKSPSTAKYPKVVEQDRHITILGNNRYEINSWVDSQNSFGATIRTRFSCIIIFEGDVVRCEDLKFNE